MSGENTPELLRCAVCNDRTNGNHFGVTACRACAAFFRRSTVGNRRYVCRFGGNCDIGKDIRCCCRACRMNKCYEVGMRTDLARGSKEFSVGRVKSTDSGDSPSSVTPPAPPFEPAYNNVLPSSSGSTPASGCSLAGAPCAESAATPPAPAVEINGRTFTVLESLPTAVPAQSNLDFSQPVTYDVLLASASTRIKSMAVDVDGLMGKQGAEPSGSILQRMVLGYRRLELLRRCAKNIQVVQSMESILSDRDLILKEGNYVDDMSAIRNDLPLASEMVNNYFQPIASFSTSVKWALLRQFFCPFIMAERSFRTAHVLPDLDDHRLLIDSESYINFRGMEQFCNVPNCKIEPARLAQIITPTFSKIVTMLVNPMRRLQLSEEEGVGLLGLLFWNDTLTTLSAQETDQVFKVQEQLIVELYNACKRNAGSNNEAAARMGIICNLVPLCVRLANEISNCFSLVNMTNAFDFDHFLTTVMPQLI